LHFDRQRVFLTKLVALSTLAAAAVPMAITTPIVTAVEGPPAVVDPNEPRYCYCNEVSFGDMVGCDNDDVSLSRTWLYPLSTANRPSNLSRSSWFPCAV
jgi:hypothetical protein